MGASPSKTFTDRDTVAKDKKQLDDIYISLVKSLNDFVKETGYASQYDDSGEFVEVADRGSVCANFGLFEDRFSKWSDEELRVFGQKLGLKVRDGDQKLDKEGTCATLFLYVQDRANFTKKVINTLYDQDKSFCLYSSLEPNSSANETNDPSFEFEDQGQASNSDNKQVSYDKVYRLYRDLKKQTQTNRDAQSKAGKTGPVGPLSTTSITNLDTAFSTFVSKRKSYISFLSSIADKLKTGYYITNRDLQKLKAEFDNKQKDFSEFCSAFYKYLDNGEKGLIQRDPNDTATDVPEYTSFRQKV